MIETNICDYICVGALFAVSLAVAIWYIAKSFSRFGLLFSAIIIGIAYHGMSTGETENKEARPTVLADDGLVVSDCYYITNGATKVGLYIGWNKIDARLPNTQPLYVSSRLKLGGVNWETIHTTTVGAFSASITYAEPDAYEYYIWTEWEPPSPVHTNGVWVGQVIEKAKGSAGVDKIVVVNGKLMENGKTIAPIKEAE